HEDVNTEIKKKIEKYWAGEVLQRNKDSGFQKKTHYVLPMFPYPSGNLHMGHVRVYSISDTLARFQILNGNDAVHPIGWDAFGLPAENAAIERNIAPSAWTKSNIDSMKTQLVQLGFNFDWEKEISTCDSKYYKWTQFIFLKLLEKGLAYQSMAQVNWDPVDKTVLADEQVDDLGCSWRSGAKVEKKYLTQWFIKTTKFAKALYDGLNHAHLENWKDIINLQKHWIGECNGVAITFTVYIDGENKTFDVWTDDPYKLIHGDFLVLSSSNALVQQLDPIGCCIKARNPVNSSEIPIYISDNVEYPEGRDVYLACSSNNIKDKELASELNIPVKESTLEINIEAEKQRAIDIALSKNVGGHFVSSKLKDWLISRQRYWGTPIPIIHCAKCGTVPVPYTDLPVTLPEISSSEWGIQTLTKVEDWVNCKCPNCQSDAKRETDTMDTFVDSSWYYYRFLDPSNDKEPFSKKCLEGHIPVDIYIGGKEHAVLHLYYARFMGYFLHSLGWTSTAEPFKKLLVQGMVMGQSYKLKSTGKYIPAEAVEKIGKAYKEKDSGEPVLMQWEKMSKSKYNGENPERLLSLYGCDTTRLLILADVPPATPRRWSDDTLPGVLNWQKRIWLSIRQFLQYRNDAINTSIPLEEYTKYENKIKGSRNYFTATATYHFKYTQHKEFELALASLIIMLAPVTPHFCSELWAGFLSAPKRLNQNSHLINWDKAVLEQTWPRVDDDFELSYMCKVDGADRCELKIKATDLLTLDHEKALQLMLEQEAIQKRIGNGILRTKYEWYPDCRAILHITTNRKVKPKKPVDEIVENIVSQ
ncbi:Leucyl-tRNA synthetase, partial [Operophtera brumata]